MFQDKRSKVYSFIHVFINIFLLFSIRGSGAYPGNTERVGIHPGYDSGQLQGKVHTQISIIYHTQGQSSIVNPPTSMGCGENPERTNTAMVSHAKHGLNQRP